MNGRPEEELLIRAFAADDGVSVAVPDDPVERWTLLRSLMNVREPLPVPEDVRRAQDDYLGRLLEERGVTDADSLEYRDGIALWKGDITTLRCGAIVNAANSGMLGCFVPCHRCIDNAIHTYAGVQLRLECASIMRGRREPVGRAVVTDAYNLPCDRVIHTVGPMVGDRVTPEDAEALRSCYRSCLEAADREVVGTVAFCCISTGEFRFPNRPAAEIAVSTVREYLSDHPGLRVVFDVFKEEDYEIYSELLGRPRHGQGLGRELRQDTRRGGRRPVRRCWHDRRRREVREQLRRLHREVPRPEHVHRRVQEVRQPRGEMGILEQGDHDGPLRVRGQRHVRGPPGAAPGQGLLRPDHQRGPLLPEVRLRQAPPLLHAGRLRPVAVLRAVLPAHLRQRGGGPQDVRGAEGHEGPVRAGAALPPLRQADDHEPPRGRQVRPGRGMVRGR